MRSTYELQTSDFVELPCHFPSGFPGLHQVPKVLKRPKAGIDPPEGGYCLCRTSQPSTTALGGPLDELVVQQGKTAGHIVYI